MKRLTVVHTAHTSEAGGAELSLRRTLVASAGWRAVLALPDADVNTGAFEGLPGSIEVIGTGPQHAPGASGGIRAAVRLARSVSTTARMLRRSATFRDADIVHANSSRAALYSALALRGSPTKFAVHLRDMVTPDALGRLGYESFRRIVLPRADLVIANSRTTLASALPHLRPTAQRRVIPSASGLLADTKLHAKTSVTRIGMLARLDPWKGQDLLLRAFAAAFPDSEVQLEFAGAPAFGHDEYEVELRSLAAHLEVADRVTFHGHVQDVDRLLQSWDVGVQASIRPEPMGQNVLQYLASGLATIVAAEGGPVEWVHDGVNGLTFAPRDLVSLCRVLIRVASDTDLFSGLQRAAVQTEGLLDDDAVADALEHAYRATLEKAS